MKDNKFFQPFQETFMSKKILYLSFILAFSSVSAQQDFGVFTGDTKDACEALLCLSTGQRPDECQPSLDRYFSIKKKKPEDTIEARHDFLKKCPASQDSQDMKDLAKAIARGAGRCDAEYLNSALQKHVTYYRCTTFEFNKKTATKKVTYHETHPGGYGNCEEKNGFVIDSKLPAYCTVYQDNAYTYNIGVKYVGSIYGGGHWE
jgi:hypothetical protein